MLFQLFTGAFFALVVAAASYAVRFLTWSGAVATFLLGSIIFGVGGWPFAIPILTFFILSSLLSKYGRSRKEKYNALFEKTSTRDGGQVIANGGIAGVIVLLSAFIPTHDFYPFYLGAVAASTADTWGTEIGVLSRGRTVSVLSLKSVSPGTSGGISEFGSIAGAVGAFVIALSGYAWYGHVKTAVIVTLAGAVGSFCDSVLGATVQAQFRCDVCGSSTERALHCGRPARRSSGIRWINNDIVNLLCSLAGALIAWALTIAV